MNICSLFPTRCTISPNKMASCNLSISNKAFLKHDSCYIFFIYGTVITWLFDDNGRQQQNSDDDHDFASELLSDVPPVAPSQASEDHAEPELWSGQKTRFSINKYKKLKDLVGKKGGLQ